MRVGSHVVQVHGYDSVDEYRVEYGLMRKETRLQEYAEKMSAKAVTIGNLKSGINTRFKKGGDHAENLKQFWHNRREKLGANSN